MGRRPRRRARALALISVAALLAGASACAPEPTTDPDTRCFDPRSREVHFPPCADGEWPGRNTVDGFVAEAPPAALRVRWVDEPGGGIPLVLVILALPIAIAVSAARARARRPGDEAVEVILFGAAIASLLAVTFAVATVAIVGVVPSLRAAVTFAAMFSSLTLPAGLGAWFGIVRCRRAGDSSAEWAVGMTMLALAAIGFVAVLWYVAQPATRLLLL